MTLFILTETSAGYALFKARDKKLLKKEDLAVEAESAEGISNMYVRFTNQKLKIKANQYGRLKCGV
jgi:nucleolar protein 58